MYYYYFFMCTWGIKTETIPVNQPQTNNSLSNVQFMKVTIAVLQCISEKHLKPNLYIILYNSVLFQKALPPMPKALKKNVGQKERKLLSYLLS